MQTEEMTNLYDLMDFDLETDRGKEPYSFQTKRDFLGVLVLDGEADISISTGQAQEFFPLQEKVRIHLPQGKTKTVKISNEAQPEKTLKLLLSNRENFEIIGG